jgi:DNA helicase-2/ATP-dependent DNA helicase PcrA
MPNLDDGCGVDDRAGAIAAYRGPLLASIAGPGTGKTYAFVERIKSLRDEGIPASKISYLTFIREIARAFTKDCEGAGIGDLPRVSTLHSFACRLVRNLGHRFAYEGALFFTNVENPKDDESAVFRMDLALWNGGASSITEPQARAAIHALKAAWQNGDNPGPESSDFAAAYFRLSKHYRLLDWDQTVVMARQLFQNEADRPAWLRAVEHLLVDEYQDFNKAEQAFIGDLTSAATTTVVVGDEHQSIFRSRGASPDGLRSLFEGAPGRITLERCRRCSSAILDAANTFMATMEGTPRRMTPAKFGGLIRCVGFKSAKAEIEYLALELTARVAALPEDPKPKDRVACLFVLRDALDYYCTQLKAKGVPCYTAAPLSEEAASRRIRLKRCLEVIARPTQRFVQRLFLDEFAALTRSVTLSLVRTMIENDAPPFDSFPAVITGAKNRGRDWMDKASLILEFGRTLERGDAFASAALLKEYGVCDFDGIEEALGQFVDLFPNGDEESLISDFCDRALPDTAADSEDPRSVAFMTVHSSKGLTLKTIVVPGLEEAWLPDEHPPDRLAEDRRLYYVAITRATDEVLVTFPGSRARGDPLNQPVHGRNSPCPFVAQSEVATERIW